jgi:hypothetical protein
MQNKRTYVIFGGVVVLVAAAAFIGGRLLNGQAGPLDFFPMMGGGRVSMAIDMIPAPELPTTEPDTRGSLVERKDNTIILREFSMELGRGGVVIVERASGGGGPMMSGGPGSEDGPKVEVVITNETIIYRDATDMPEPSAIEEQMTIQQAVEPGTLDDLTSNTMIMVWGRKSGDRFIADVIMYSTPVLFKRDAP